MDLQNPMYYVNREYSWLEFNMRVLEEAQDKSNPLMERLKFLAITSSNLDEFFMVRVSGLWELQAAGVTGGDPSGMTPSQQLSMISKKIHELVHNQYNCLNRSILPALEKQGIVIQDWNEIDEKQAEFAIRYFNSTIYPILTPMAIDQGRPFPLLNNKNLYLVIELADKEENEEPRLHELTVGAANGEPYFAIMQIPTVIPRILTLPSSDGKKEFILLEEIIKNNLDALFPGHRVLKNSLFRITRNSDLDIDEEDAEDLLNEMERSIKRRKWGDPIRIEIEKKTPRSSRKFLKTSLELDDEDIYEISGPLDTTVWMNFCLSPDFEHLRNKPLPPQPCVDFMTDEDMFSVIRERDVLAHHPYDSFDCVVDYVKAAAYDPQVLAIKQTLYRVSGNSPIVNALILAAENGKQVTVLVELKARFDEENNIHWAKKLEKSGCHVVYGLVGLKTHCKICLVVRKEDDGIRRYVHLGTGNYNDNTAKIYTDLGYFTCRETIGQDMTTLFNTLTGYSVNTDWNKIAVAPVTLRRTFLWFIENEIKNASEGKDAYIMAKMNSLVDVDIIQALYRASMAGVRIKLLVRGICCLKSGIEGVSDNITVMSIVDRFLEHSRIYYFENAGNPKIFLSSADWMPRNLDRRVEVAFPIEDQSLREKLIEILDISFSDTVKLRLQQPDGTYAKVDRRGKESIHSQLLFHKLSSDRVQAFKEESSGEIFKPVLQHV